MSRIIFGFLGTDLDNAQTGEDRWQKWRPTVSLFSDENFPIDEFHLFHGNGHKELAQTVLSDIREKSPVTRLHDETMSFTNPWDFEEVFEKSFDFFKNYAFKPQENEYLFNIATGTHVMQIVVFSLINARIFPGKLLQTKPRNDKKFPWKGVPASIDLALEKYARITQLFRQEYVNNIKALMLETPTRPAAPESDAEPKFSVIWNVTHKCAWDCAFCCMDSRPQTARFEMSFAQKMAVAEKLKEVAEKSPGVNCRVDLSGGEVMLNRDEHLPLIKRLSQNLGKDNVGLSCSGKNIDEGTAQKLAEVIADVEMTMDAAPGVDFPYRPKKYHQTAGDSARRLKKCGVTVGLQTVLTQHHKNPRILEDLYAWLCENHIDHWSILKFFPAGRGNSYPYLELSDNECVELGKRIRQLDAQNSAPKPQLDFHYLLPGTEKNSHCRCVRKSIGILPDGRAVACFWAVGEDGHLRDPRFLLGDVTQQPLTEILASKNSQYWRDYCANHRECALCNHSGE
ncbi:hypothetical protein AGMMS49959_15520 [Planctomycetales bacterium]|nr:hypothetical protein AGMMS49959_15520 [Planctomycetales bacterium]